MFGNHCEGELKGEVRVKEGSDWNMGARKLGLGWNKVGAEIRVRVNKCESQIRVWVKYGWG